MVLVKWCDCAGFFTGLLPRNFNKQAHWRDGRVVDCVGLENRSAGNGTVGSNPSLSAKLGKFCANFINLKHTFTMRNGEMPDPNKIFPIPGITTVAYVKPTIKNPNIIVGDFTYFSDADFEKHVTHHYDFNGDKLVIGKFCQIAAGVNFVMNGANHQMNAVSTFPFYIFEGWDEEVPPLSKMPLKGDTVVGNDVWIGQNATILPGIKIGDGAIIGANTTVGHDVSPYTIVVGNPAREVRKRFDDELIELMLKLQWWDMEIEQINDLIPLLTDPNLEAVKEKIRALVKKNK